MKTTEQLLLATKDIWQQYNQHPFVLGIQDGTLDKEKFRYYIIQDYLYLEDYARTFAVGVAKAKSLKMANLFAKYIAVMNGELDVHTGYLAKLGITQEEIHSTPRALDNLSYTSYMLRVAYEEGEVEILAAILSCAYSYEVIAKMIVENNPASINNEFYGDWIKGYVSDGYAEENVVAHFFPNCAINVNVNFILYKKWKIILYNFQLFSGWLSRNARLSFSL